MDKVYKLKIKALICDAPARSCLKGVIGHTGYFSCERCEIKGSWDGRGVFISEEMFPGRVDTAFNYFEYTSHQKFLSPLVTSGISCVIGFVLDCMHLVCLGVVRRLLNYIKKGPPGRISASQIK